ncbi:uncharacterized protein [Littorina saxatilis]|uniref:uncharacterized protein n=1 Tax=Littorina saxatilis TaxID=31220 RepID=UPI0038B6AFCA
MWHQNSTDGHMLCACPQGAAVDYLGALDTPWQVEVSISSGGGGLASMIGNTTVNFVNGTVDFSGLGIDRMGNYILDFNITHPVEAANYSLQSLTVNVLGRNVRTEGELLSTSRIVNTPLSLTFRLVDIDTGDNITAINWRDHTWTATVTTSDPDAYPGSLGGTTCVPPRGARTSWTCS